MEGVEGPNCHDMIEVFPVCVVVVVVVVEVVVVAAVVVNSRPFANDIMGISALGDTTTSLRSLILPFVFNFSPLFSRYIAFFLISSHLPSL